MEKENSPESQVYLTVEGGAYPQHVRLTGQTTIGCEPGCNLVLPDSQASRQHARVFPHKGGYAVEDLKSRHGTLVNGERLVAPVRLHDGDVIRIGKTSIRFAFGRPVPAAPDGHEIVRSLGADQPGFLDESSSPDQAKTAWPRLKALYAVQEAVSTLEDEAEVGQVVLRQLFELISAQSGAIILQEPSGQLLTLCAIMRDGTPDPDVKVSKTLLSYVVQNRVALVTSDAANDPRLAGTGDVEASVLVLQIHSAVSVPLIVKGRVLGVLQLLFDIPGALVPEEDVRWLTSVAHQAAVAIESARLHRERKKMIADLLDAKSELQTRVEHLRILNEIERSLASNHDLESFLDRIVSEAVTMLSATGGAMLLIPAEGGPASVAHVAGDRELAVALHESALGRRIVESVRSSGTVLRLGFDEMRADLDESLTGRMRNVIAVPLIARGDSKVTDLGLLELFNKADGPFTSADADLITFLAAQITSAMLRKQLLLEKANSDRLSSVGSFAGSILHDIRNPLTRIRGYAELCARPNVTDENRAKYCRTIMAGVDRCSNMSSEILRFVRGETSLTLAEISAQEFFDGIIVLLESDIQNAKLNFETAIEYQGPLLIDADKMNRVIFNLSNNAIRVLKPGDTLSLSCRVVAGEIEIRVADTGPGIPIELLPRLFQPFATQGDHGGTGLGLSIVRSIVKSHGGRIFLDDSASVGACFVIRLKPPPEAAR